MGKPRTNDVMVRLSDEELARLDELRPSGTPRATFMRSLLQEPPSGNEVATRTEALAILSPLCMGSRGGQEHVCWGKRSACTPAAALRAFNVAGFQAPAEVEGWLASDP
jgi:hypothetical protein